MATRVVDFAFQTIAGKLEKLLEDEVALVAGVEGDVRYMVAELKSINAFLTVMSTRRNLDDQLQNWVQEVREVAYDAEDSIVEFECRLPSTPYDELGVVEGLFMRFCDCLKSLKARHDVASKLHKLKVEVEEIKNRHDRYSRPNEATSSGTATSWDMADRYSDPRISGHFEEEAQLVGINQSREMLIKWVLDENYLELTTISLVGFGGSGKTTLAKTIYDNPIIVGGHFQYRAWIAVSQTYNLKELLKKIIRQISVSEQQVRDVLGCQDASMNTEQLLNMMDDSQLVQTIKGHLRGKRYLLVFDDVWRPEAWKSLSIALPSGNEGSRVIVTTRSEEVANVSCSRNRRFIFKISPLSPEQSWELFCRKVFEAPLYSCPPDLEAVGREILQKCNGLPLAIVTIGGLLSSKSENIFEEWKDLRDHLPLEIDTNEMLSNIKQILILSYNDLPYYLKPCFLFLGIFPEDYEIGRKRLMRRWIAEGIVNGLGGFSAEKVAERCFNQLVSRNLLQPSEFNYNGIVKSCHVHDMMLDVIISISREENFMVLLNEPMMNLRRHQKIRHLSQHEGSSGLVPNTDLSHLRSFTAFGEHVLLKDYRQQRLLRAIDLESGKAFFDLHPKSFSKLFLLKYLSLRNPGLSELPDSIGDLQNLEFLDIRQTSITKLPNSFVRLQKLVHMLTGRYFKESSDKVYIMGFNVPKGIRRLKKLRKLEMVSAGNMQLLQEIGELVDLQKLAIRFGSNDQYLERLMLEEFSALLSKFNGSLRSLIIWHETYGNLKRALDEVAPPPLLLCKLKIDAELGGLPAWFASLNQVVEINLQNTRLHLQDLQVLRNLHSLVKLVLGRDAFNRRSRALVFDRGGFTQLKFLDIGNLTVSFEEGAVQSLEILKMIYFTGFSFNVIEHLHGLKEVHIDTWDEDTMEMVKNIAANHSNRPKCFATLFGI